MSTHRISTALWLALALGLGASRAIAADAQAIYGGSKVKPCGWPTTVALGGCTGTLVHPELVIFAAHCMEGGGGPSKVTFGDNENSPAFSVSTTSCKSDPKYYGQSGRDVAFCKLSKPVTQVPIVPILMGCETQSLVAGAEVVAVGFGQANDGLGWGPKREVTMKLNSIKNGEAFIGGAGKDTCYGDSGGPVYIQLGDGTWRVFGITSYGEYCGGGGYYSMMHTAIDWLEQTSGIDLTPCHQQGQWAPTAACSGFPKSPNLGGGAWAQGCATTDLSGPSATCGAPFGGGPTGGGGSGGAPPSGGGGSGGSSAGGSGNVGGGGPSGGAGNGGAGNGGEGSGGFGAGSSGGDPGGYGGEGSGGNAGGGSSGGGGASVGQPGCSSAPDCSACASCADHCTCATGDAEGCAVACAPYGPSSGPGTSPPSAPPNEAAPRDNSEVTAGCACRAGRNAPPPAPLALLALSLVSALALRRQR
ncbi:MAG: trypsin-like serine protease [Polyangiaceae bacterium]|nr:trypsin-like serine protease [Polyangiaceae bacterium]MCL4750250.1 trypsin-like serine protease [Myxococcales bacterium]